MKKRYILPILGFVIAVAFSCTAADLVGNTTKNETIDTRNLLDENGYYVEQQTGVDAYYSQDYAKALDIFEKGAELGDPVCITYLGCCYYYGAGVENDVDIALEYLDQGASQGNALAMAMLGDYNRDYLNDNENAVNCYLDSANNGNAYAMNQYGLYCLNGYFGEGNEEIAAGWFEEAANNGNADGMCNLGYCYLNGIGVDEDYNSAAALFEDAADLGSLTGYYNLAYCYEFGYGVESNLDQAMEYYQVAADYGYESAVERVASYQQELEEQAEWEEEQLQEQQQEEQSDQSEPATIDIEFIRKADTPDTWGDPETWTWGKSYYVDTGMPVIYNKDFILGTYQSGDGSEQKDVGLRIYHTEIPKNHMYFSIHDENGQIQFNGCSSMTMTVTAPDRNPIDMGIHADNQDYLEYDPGVKGLGYIPGLLNSIQEDDYEIRVTLPDGGIYSFIMPAASDYRKVWNYVSGVWAIPTDNQDIYTGTDVSPDLIKFLSKYENAVRAEINAGVIVGGNVTYANVKQLFLSSNELAPLQKQYDLVCDYVYRKVDAEYLDRFQNAMVETYFVNPAANTVVNMIGEHSEFWGAVAGFVNDAVQDNGGWGSLF